MQFWFIGRDITDIQVLRINRSVSSVVKTLLLVREVWAFDSRACQIGHSFNGSPPLRRFFGVVLPKH